MTLWRRAPREVYRVYGEEEYLGGDALSADEASHHAPAHEHGNSRHAVVGSPSYRAQAGRLVGLGLLVGVIVSAAALVVLNATHRPPTAPPSTVAHVARPDGAARASSGAASDGGSPVSASKSPMPRVRARAREGAHSSTGHTSTDHPSGGRSSTRQLHRSNGPTGEPSAEHAGEPALAGRSAESVSGAASAQSRRPTQSTTSELTGSGGQAPPIDGEFGFER